MPKVIKGNVQLTIEEHKIDEFLKLGYSLIDENGNITKVGEATTLEAIKAENATLKTELTKVKAENEKLKKENAKLKKE